MLLLLCTIAEALLAAPFWGATQSSPVDMPLAALAPGELIWEDASASPQLMPGAPDPDPSDDLRRPPPASPFGQSISMGLAR